MEINTFFNIVKNRRKAVILVIIIFVVAALAVTFSQPLKYQATSRLLIIQENANPDPYAISKSNQYLGSLLSETVYSGSFFDLLASSGSNINWGYFNGTYKQQIKRWKETVSARSVNDTGIIEVNIYHPDQEQARQISLNVDNLLMTQNGLYQSSNTKLKLKVIDQPIVSSYPVKPNIILNLGASLILGCLFGLLYVYYFPVSRRRRHSANLGRKVILEKPEEYNPVRQEQNEEFRGDIRNIIN